MARKTAANNGKSLYDWEAIKREYVVSEWLTVSDFAKSKGIPLNTIYQISASEKWLDEKNKYRADTTKKAYEAKQAEDVAEVCKSAERRREDTKRGLDLLKCLAERRLNQLEADTAPPNARELNDLASVYFRVNDVEGRLNGLKSDIEDGATVIANALLEAASKESTNGEPI